MQRLLVSAVLAGVVSACGPGVDCSTVSYAADIAPAFAESCLPCHSASVRGPNRQGAPREVDYDTYDEVKASAGSIAQRLAGAGARMPPVTSSQPVLSSAVIEKFNDWRICNSPP